MEEKSLIIVESLHNDRYRHYRNELFPFIKGFAMQKHIPVEWILYGIKFIPDLSCRFFIDLDKDSWDHLEASIIEKKATHILFNDTLSESFASLIRKKFPCLKTLSVSDLPLEISRYYLPLARDAFNNTAWLKNWLGVEMERGKRGIPLIERVNPDFNRIPGNKSAAGIDPFIKILCGYECYYRKSIKKNPFFKGVDLSDAYYRYGCTFCYRSDDFSWQFEMKPLDLAVKQIECAVRTIPSRKTPYPFMIMGARLFSRIADFYERLISMKLPPSFFLFSCRIDELIKKASVIEKLLPEIQKYKLGFHVWNIAAENFSKRERDRLNKNLSLKDIHKAFKLLQGWEKSYPGTFSNKIHGGISFILFTPWTTVSDLEHNIRMARKVKVEDDWRFLKSKLQLFENYPITLLARHDGLLIDSFKDLPYDAGVVQSDKMKDLPWKYKHTEIGVIYNIICRMFILPDEEEPVNDKRYEIIQAWVKSLPENVRYPLIMFEAIVKVVKDFPKERNLEKILSLAGMALKKNPRIRKKKYKPLTEKWNREKYKTSPFVKKIMTLLEKDAKSPPEFSGYKINSLQPLSESEICVTLLKKQESFDLLVEEKKPESKYFCATEQYAISHRQEMKVDSPDKTAAIHAFRNFLAFAEKEFET